MLQRAGARLELRDDEENEQPVSIAPSPNNPSHTFLPIGGKAPPIRKMAPRAVMLSRKSRSTTLLWRRATARPLLWRVVAAVVDCAERPCELHPLCDGRRAGAGGERPTADGASQWVRCEL